MKNDVNTFFNRYTIHDEQEKRLFFAWRTPGKPEGTLLSRLMYYLYEREVYVVTYVCFLGVVEGIKGLINLS